MGGRLNYSMYAARDAAANCSGEYAQRLVEIGFKLGRATPCVLYHKEIGLRTYIHGDDFVIVGKPQELKWMQGRLERKYELTVEALWPDKGQQREVQVLNGAIRWRQGCIEYEADPRHAQLALQQFNINDCNAVATPGTREEGRAKNGDEECMRTEQPLSEERSSSHRAIVARGKYIAPDRPDIA